MLINYLKTSFRSLRNKPIYSIITIMGLAISFAALTITLLYLTSEFNTDKVHKNYDYIYRLEGKRWFNVPAPLKDLVDEYMTDAEASTRTWHGSISGNYENQQYNISSVIFADGGFKDIFTIEMVQGEIGDALTVPGKLLISESEAERLCGAENPIGKQIELMDDFSYTITGVFKDLPKNVHMPYNALSALMNQKIIQGQEDYFDNWSNWNYLLYIKLHQQAVPKVATQGFLTKFKEFMIQQRGTDDGYEPDFYLRHIKDVYFYEGLQKTDQCKHGNKLYMSMFLWAAIMILIIAVINYVNLATARAGLRAKEIGIRKTIGAEKSQIIKQFLIETFLITSISVIISIALTYLILPYFNSMMKKNLILSITETPIAFAIIFISSVCISLIAGIYPALFLATKNTIGILKKETIHGRKGLTFRRILIFVQLTTTVGLTLAALIVTNQMRFMIKHDMGVKKDQVLFFYLPSMSSAENFKNELQKSSNILEVSHCHSMLTNIGMEWGRDTEDGETVNFYVDPIDEDFIDLMGITILEGRNFNPDTDEAGAFIVNESFIRNNQVENIDDFVFDDGKKIIGVVKDFQFQTLHHSIKPLAFHYPPIWSYNMAVKVKADAIPTAIEDIEKVWKNVSDRKLRINFLDEVIAFKYWQERQFGIISASFSFLAILISAMGVLGLITFEAERRVKEIGVRKTLGATSMNILYLFLSELLVLILAACIVSWLGTAFIMNNWLANFAYNTGLKWWLFAVAGVVTTIIAVGAYSYQAIKASRANPVESLKYE